MGQKFKGNRHLVGLAQCRCFILLLEIFDLLLHLLIPDDISNTLFLVQFYEEFSCFGFPCLLAKGIILCQGGLNWLLAKVHVVQHCS